MFWRKKTKPVPEGLLSVALSAAWIAINELGENDDAVRICGFATAFIEATGKSEYNFRGCSDDFINFLWKGVCDQHPSLLGSFQLFLLSFVEAGHLLEASHPALAIDTFVQDSNWSWKRDRNELEDWAVNFLAAVRTLIVESAVSWQR